MWETITTLFDEGQPVPRSLEDLDEFDTSEWESVDRGYEETQEEPAQEEIKTEGEEE